MNVSQGANSKSGDFLGIGHYVKQIIIIALYLLIARPAFKHSKV